MSATNLTKNLKLPQFVASDKPSWLGDVNGAMLKIDNGIGTIKSDITKANDTASSAKSQSDANTVTLGNVNTELESIGNRVTALEAGGGTEPLEQKVKTNTDDIEALQTRADTFEEEIADNGSKISANTKSITELTPRVKSCEDNITTLQTSNTTVLDEIQALHEVNTQQGQLIATAQSDATSAKNRADSAYALASNANNTANSAYNTANSLASQSLTFYSSDASSGTASPLYALISDSTLTVIPLTITLNSVTANFQLCASYTLPSNISVLSGTGESSTYVGNTLYGVTAGSVVYNTYLEVSGNVLNVYIKFPSVSGYNKTTFNNIYVPLLTITK